jgi:hypothetical protein
MTDPAGDPMTDRTADPAGEPSQASHAPAEMGDGDTPSSGLRNPAAAIRGVGMGTLILEFVALLLAIQPIRMVAPDTPGWALGLVAGLAIACLVVAGLLRHAWAWHVGTGLQVVIALTGLVQYAVAILGVLFFAIWLYVLHIRRTLSQPAKFDH